MQLSGGNPRLNQLCARWQQVWLLALDRQRKLNDALDRLEEVGVSSLSASSVAKLERFLKLIFNLLRIFSSRSLPTSTLTSGGKSTCAG